jgi:ADP-ribose pyrophosphatase YjhB (NUDIX family)
LADLDGGQRLGAAAWPPAAGRPAAAGTAEPGELLEQTVVREVAEEGGVEVTAGPLVCSYLLIRPSVRRNSIGAFFVASPVDEAVDPRTQVPDEITEAAYLDPGTLPADLLGPVTSEVIARWWPHRRGTPPEPFHVAVQRTDAGYRRLES